jgi:hypothetical protein
MQFKGAPAPSSLDPIRFSLASASNIAAETGAKRVGLLHALLPGAARFAALVNP